MLNRLSSVAFSAIILVSTLVTTPLRADPPIHLTPLEKLVVTYVIHGIGQTSAEQVANLQALQTKIREFQSQPVQTVPVQSFEEFLQKFSEFWPHAHDLKAEIEIVIAEEGKKAPEKFISSDPAVQTQIDEYLRSRNERAKVAIRNAMPNNPELEQALTMIGEPSAQNKLLELAQNPALAALGVSQEKMVHEAYARMEEGLVKAFELIQGAGEKLLTPDPVDPSKPEPAKLDPMKRELIKFMLTEYFKSVSLRKKKIIAQRLLCGELTENIQNDPERIFKVFLGAAGSQFKKMIQILARENVPARLAELFKVVEKSDLKVPYSIVKRIIGPEMKDYGILEFSEDPIGTGSIAQNQAGKAYRRGRDGKMGEIQVAIRFIKPGVPEDLAEDREILTNLAAKADANEEMQKAGIPKLGGLINTIDRGAQEDTNLRQAENRQIKGEKFYAKGNVRQVETQGRRNPIRMIEVSVPHVYLSNNKATRNVSKISMTELVAGKKLDKVAAQFADTIPHLKRDVIDLMSEVWFEELLWGEGFYHSDLHQGNFLVEIVEEGRGKRKVVKLRILDFGMAGNLTPELQNSLLEVGAAITSLDPKSLVECYWNVRNRNKSALSISKEEFANRVTERCESMKSGKLPLEGPIKWLSWAINQGLSFQYGFENLNRGVAIIQASLADANPNRSMIDVLTKVAQDHPIESISKGLGLVWRGHLKWDAFASLAEQELKEVFGIDVRKSKRSPIPPSSPSLGSSSACQSIFAN